MLVRQTAIIPQFYKFMSTEEMISPNERDILLGRGGSNNKNKGNQILRDLCRDKASEYSKSSKRERARIINCLLDESISQARFLIRQRVNGLWEVAGRNISREKVSRTLRNALYELEGKEKDRALDEYQSCPHVLVPPPGRYEDDQYYWLLRSNKCVRKPDDLSLYTPESESYFGSSSYFGCHQTRRASCQRFNPILGSRKNVSNKYDQNKVVPYNPMPSQSIKTSLKKRSLQYPSFVTIRNENDHPNKRTRYDSSSNKRDLTTSKPSHFHSSQFQKGHFILNHEEICTHDSADNVTADSTPCGPYEKNTVSLPSSDDDDSSYEHLTDCSFSVDLSDDNSLCLEDVLNPMDCFGSDDISYHPGDCLDREEDSLLAFLDEFF